MQWRAQPPGSCHTGRGTALRLLLLCAARGEIRPPCDVNPGQTALLCNGRGAALGICCFVRGEILWFLCARRRSGSLNAGFSSTHSECHLFHWQDFQVVAGQKQSNGSHSFPLNIKETTFPTNPPPPPPPPPTLSLPLSPPVV